MKQQTGKVFFACALGAFVGALMALQIRHAFWWVGLLAGFSVGYLAYEVKKVIEAVPVAWKRATSWRWHPDKAWWKAYGKLSLTFLGCGLTLAIGFTALFAGMQSVSNMILSSWTSVAGWSMVVCLSIAGVYISLVAAICDTSMLENMKRELSVVSNPCRFYFWIAPRGVYQGITILISILPELATDAKNARNMIGRFFAHLFRLIHSELRLLCGVDAAIGAAAGYYLGNAIAGAIIGGLWGVLNFEVLSIRVRKLVPAAQSVFRQ
jgi:hypothetical protein